jgi:hypothetical protein
MLLGYRRVEHDLPQAGLALAFGAVSELRALLAPGCIRSRPARLLGRCGWLLEIGHRRFALASTDLDAQSVGQE